LVPQTILLRKLVEGCPNRSLAYTSGGQRCAAGCYPPRVSFLVARTIESGLFLSWWMTKTGHAASFTPSRGTAPRSRQESYILLGEKVEAEGVEP
jgi:hypothetical protein